jgi:3-hydroxyisobutyrate dehydrogenase-like beta-hydroxyacid dehydrogenase
MATDLVRAGADVAAYDPAEVRTPEGVNRFVHPALAVQRADLVIGATAASDATLSLLQAVEAIPSESLYADLSTGSPQLKAELAEYAAKRDLDFADVALMSMVPGNGLSTPALASGTGAERYCDLINPLGGDAEALNGPPGTAAAKKLLRSVMMKGTAAVLIEAVRAGAAFDDLEWLWSNLRKEIEGADERWMRRMVTGSKTHARRRKAEMEAAASMLDELEVPSDMTRATIVGLAQLLDGDLPDLPDQMEYPAPSHRSS